MYDMIVVGAGPAGLTAALYALRADKSVLILEKETFGGQITFSPKVENYPGILQMSGNEFAERLIEQVLSHGAQIELEAVTGIEPKGDIRLVHTEANTYESKTVVIAAGSKHRQLGLPNEDRLIGEGVSYCAVCDGPFYNGKTVAVIGGGNTALQEAVLLSEYCKRVYVVQNLPTLTGEGRLAATLQERPNVEIRLNRVVDTLVGETSLEKLILKDPESDLAEELAVDGIFVAIGQEPENQPFAGAVALDERGYIAADESCRTADPAVFVAGDCRAKAVRQITTATGDGAVAALAACRYIDGV